MYLAVDKQHVTSRWWSLGRTLPMNREPSRPHLRPIAVVSGMLCAPQWRWAQRRRPASDGLVRPMRSPMLDVVYLEQTGRFRRAGETIQREGQLSEISLAGPRASGCGFKCASLSAILCPFSKELSYFSLQSRTPFLFQSQTQEAIYPFALREASPSFFHFRENLLIQRKRFCFFNCRAHKLLGFLLRIIVAK